MSHCSHCCHCKVERERNRLRDFVDRLHTDVVEALGNLEAIDRELQTFRNATPLDSPDGTGSGIQHEHQRRRERT